MTYWEKYEMAVADAERWAHDKEMRTQQLRRLYQGKDATTIQRLVDADPDVKDAQLLHERAVARAAMYGPGALMQVINTVRVRG